MTATDRTNRLILLVAIFILPLGLAAQRDGITWLKDGNSYISIEQGEIMKTTLPTRAKATVISKAELTPPGLPALEVR